MSDPQIRDGVRLEGRRAPLERRNLLILAAAVATIAAGYVLLQAGSSSFAAVLLVLLCNAIGVATDWRFLPAGAAALLQPTDSTLLLGRISQSFEGCSAPLEADSADFLPNRGRFGFIKPGRLRLRPVPFAILVTPFGGHPALPRPPPTSRRPSG